MATFWSKFMVLANVQKWDTDAKKMAHIPLMLDNAAYLVYDSLSDNERRMLGR